MCKIKRVGYSAVWALCVLVLAACTQKTQWSDNPEPVGLGLQFNENLFGEAPLIPKEGELLALDESIKQDFYTYFNKPELASHLKVERVGSYLSLLVDQYTYSEHTYTAQQTVDNKGGNCLSLTLLTTAIARLAGVEVSYDLLGGDLTFALQGDVLLSADHMRAVLREDYPADPDAQSKSTFKRLTIDYFDTRGMSYTENVSSAYQLSLYYSNRAAELLIDKDQTNAFYYARKALDIHSSNHSALNTLALLHSRNGDMASAEAIYQAAITDVELPQLVFYRNYMALLENQGRVIDLQGLQQRYSLVKQSHPLEWIRAGKKAHTSGDYDLAITLFDKALEIAPEMHGVHLLKARSNVAVGNIKGAKLQLQKALTTEVNREEAAVYQRKLAKLQQYQLR